jgi:hypothetical protein
MLLFVDAVEELFGLLVSGHVLQEHRDRVRRIGWDLFYTDGLLGMQAAYRAVCDEWRACGFSMGADRPHPAEINMAWDGVGYWRS